LQTIFLTGLHPKVDDVEIFDLFSQVGRVDDVQLIKDSKGKSKGMCYVEFASREQAEKGALLNGQLIGGFPMSITLCQPKNATGTVVGAVGAAGAGAAGSVRKPPQSADSIRLYVGSLHYNITEKDLEPIFEAFGPLDSVEIHRDSATRTSKGFGFVQFRRREDGETAMAALDGYDIGGRNIKVSYANPTDHAGSRNIPRQGQMPQQQAPGVIPTMPLAQQYATPAAAPPPLPAAPSAAVSSPAPPPSLPPLSVAQLTPSPCVLVSNMFNPAEEAAAAEDGTDWAAELAEDVGEEAGKHGRLAHLFVDPVDPAGRVYLRFQGEDSAQAAQKALHGRWFANRQLTAEFLTAEAYAHKFPADQQQQQQQ
jgi:RNA-binding protein 39